ncbi:F-box protein SKIP23-like [Senna tora]|uniref:F-box protein SKIP23-like n=1 Tax=Senna tora TaxID=362788 RepID=A0A834TZP2_9FABA|nr:F-box protein SKIP23-like [Senna tora]
MSVGWNELPPEIIQTICAKLINYADYIRFRCVCKIWRSSVPQTPHNLPPQLPWLMLPLSHSSTHQSRRAFFNLSNHKTLFLHLPHASHPRRCCGSSHGWLVLLDDTPEILLLNPLAGANLHLPPLHTFPNVVSFSFSNIGREYVLRNSHGHLYTRNLRQMRNSFLRKVVLSSTPSQTNQFMALAILGHTNLAFCKHGDDSWTFIDKAHNCWEDVVFHNGKFYAVKKGGTLAVLDIQDRFSPRLEIIEMTGQFQGDMQYLVFSRNELLFVARYLELEFNETENGSNLVYKTVGFNVSKMNWSASQWQKLDSLGDQMLFLGDNSSLSLCASDFPRCFGDCIYYTDDYSESNFDGAYGRYDLGIYKLWDRSIDPLPCYPPNVKSRLGCTQFLNIQAEVSAMSHEIELKYGQRYEEGLAVTD